MERMLDISSRIDFSLPRLVSKSLPRLAHGPDLSRRVNLVGASESDLDRLFNFAEIDQHGQWHVLSDDMPAREALDDLLPRAAQKWIVPEIVSLIPAGSWFASLANLLVGSSWKSLKDPFLQASGGCEQCGNRHKLEAHEGWEYDALSKIQTLSRIRPLCSRCHATQHLGRANVVGNFGGVFHRLCMINRIEFHEEDAYKEAIFSLFEERSRTEWKLDVSAAVEHLGALYLKADVLFAGDGWIHRPSEDGESDVAMQIVNCDIGFDGKRLVLVPSGTI